MASVICSGTQAEFMKFTKFSHRMKTEKKRSGPNPLLHNNNTNVDSGCFSLVWIWYCVVLSVIVNIMSIM